MENLKTGSSGNKPAWQAYKHLKSSPANTLFCICLTHTREMLCLTIEANIGRNRVVVAVLLEHSVNMATSRHNRMEMAKGGMLCSGTRLSPSHKESPDFFMRDEKTYISSQTFINRINSFQKLVVSCVTSLPWANAKPPPRSKRMFQGIFSWTISQLSRGEGASAGVPIRTSSQRRKIRLFIFRYWLRHKS